MYCSSCGLAVAAGLSYCNHCGVKLNRGESGISKSENAVVRSSDVKPESLIWGMIAVFFFGLVGTTMLLGVMRAVLQLHPNQILTFAFLSFAIMLLLEGVFIYMLLRRTRGAVETGAAELSSREQVTNELDAAHARALPQPAASVTEHTTRTFEPLYTERPK
jgi:hypothetical protein